MDGYSYRERLDRIRSRIDEASHRFDLALIEAWHQIERVDDLLDRCEAARLAKRRTAAKAA
jgi:hypothetical protein